MLCMTQYICASLQSAGGFILEEDWTPTKTKLLQLTTYRGGSLISFQDKNGLLHPRDEVIRGSTLIKDSALHNGRLSLMHITRARVSG